MRVTLIKQDTKRVLSQVGRPDGKPDLLGLKVLDEPAAIQSDPSVLAMQLRHASKQASTSGLVQEQLLHGRKANTKHCCYVAQAGYTKCLI